MNQDPAQLCIDTIRTLSMDAVQKANSGHPGTPMALAPIAYGLWQKTMRFDPSDPTWFDRDRFVLSCGHASMLLYSVLHLAGVRDPESGGEAVSLEEITRFRQLGSRTPGHPEFGHTAGVETTTGPLGQGIANSVGMAMAREFLASRFNRPGFELFRFRTFALCSDGDLMEGIGSEAASIAGHLRLSDLCWLYDENGITIDGETKLSYSEDVERRFEGYGWRVERVRDANDLANLQKALAGFEEETRRPTLIIVNSEIGFGSPNRQNTSKAHGEPLGADEVQLTKASYGWPEDEDFLVPEGVREHMETGLGARGRDLCRRWKDMRAAYAAEFPELSRELELIETGGLPEGWDAGLPEFEADPKGMATRAASGKALNALAERIPWVLGGSADLTPSNKTYLGFEGAGVFSPQNHSGRNLHFGVREHAMAAIANGMSLSGLRPYVGTFLIFSDYMRGSQRLSALMKQPVTYVFTHDSIGVGEDGPTHQPIEQLAALRAMPNMIVIRPGDANETVEAWKVALATTDAPVCLSLTRQGLPTLDREKYAAASNLSRGAYVLRDAPGGDAQVILIGTGSELHLCVQASEALAKDGIQARVVSMPSWELFERQPQVYRGTVLPKAVKARVAVEQASGFGWERWVGDSGAVIAMQDFGASAPFGDLQKHFGFTVDAIVEASKKQLSLARA